MNGLFDFLVWVSASCVCLLIWSVGIRGLLLDGFRERLHQLRFRLFQIAMEGEISFEDPAYRELEKRICGLIEFANRVTFITYLYARYEQARESRQRDYVDIGNQITEKFAHVKQSTRNKLGDIAQGVRHSLLIYMIKTSVPLLTIVGFSAILKKLKIVKLDRARERISKPIEYAAYRWLASRSSRWMPATIQTKHS